MGRFLVVLSLLVVVTSCEPSAVEREISMPRVTVIQITATPGPHLTPAKTVIRTTATPVIAEPVTVEPAAMNTVVVEPTATYAKQSYYVGNTGGDGVYIRRTHDMDDRIKAWPDDTKMIEISGWLDVGGRLWRHVVDPDGNEGYVPAEYLVDSVAEATAVPVLSAPPRNTPDETSTATIDGLLESDISAWSNIGDLRQRFAVEFFALRYLTGAKELSDDEAEIVLMTGVYQELMIPCLDAFADSSHEFPEGVTKTVSEIVVLCALEYWQ